MKLAAKDLRTDEAGFWGLRRKLLGRGRSNPVVVDLVGAETLDLAQVALLMRLSEEAREQGLHLDILGLPEPVAGEIEHVSAALLGDDLIPPPSESLIERIGEKTLMAEADLQSWTGSLTEALHAIFIEPLAGKGWKGRTVIEQMDLIGVRAALIIIFISMLVGVVLAINGVRELARLGASIFIADLVGVAMTRELGPLITAVMVAGRSGSAIAAELGTMVVGEEVDALETMGFSPVRFLVVPRLIAMVAMVPCLTVLSDVFGIGAGGMMAMASTGMSTADFMTQTAQALNASDVLHGLLKSAVFAFLTGLISCRAGLAVTGGAEGVGAAATKAVVVSVISVIAADAVFTYLFYALGS